MSRIYSIIIAMAMVFSLVSCSKENDEINISGNVNATEKTPETEYSLKIEHISLTSGNNSVTETHSANLFADNKKVASKNYDFKWKVQANSFSIKRSEAKKLEHTEIDYTSEGVDISGHNVKVTLTEESCGTVYFDEIFTTYCHPSFPEDNCIEELTNCNISVKKITFGVVSGNQLICSAVIGTDNHTCNYPLTINVTADDEEVQTSHVKAELNGNVLLDHHKATLVRNGQTADSDNYVATWSLSYNTISVVRSVAEKLVGTQINNNNGFDVNGQTLKVNLQLSNCSTAKLDGKIYYHPNFPTDGGISALDCCNPEAATLKLNNIIDNKLYGTVTISSDHGSIEYPVEIGINEDPVVEPEDEYDVVINDDLTFGNGKATVSVDLYKNGDKVKTVNLENAFNATLKAGAQINKTSNGSVSLNNTVATLGNGTASFTYSLNGTSFGDAWTWSAPSKVTFTYEWNGIKKSKTFTINYEVKSTNFSGNNGSYRNNASLFANGTAVADDAQAIVISAPEPEDEYDVVINDDLTFGNGKATVSVDLYKNGDKVKTVNLENAFNATLKAGAQINKTSNGSVSLNNTVATLGNGTASFVYTLAGTSFGDAWTWSAPSKVTFTYEWNGIKKSKDFTVNYAVKSTNFSGNNGSYSNNASLFANGTAIASDVQTIVVTKPMDKTINGYTAIAAYITNCYHSNGSLVDDGKHLAVVFRNDSNPSQYIIRHADTNGKVIEDHYANNVDENAVFSFITLDGKMQPAYLDVIMSGNSPKEWGYLHIGSNKIFAINNMIVTTNRLSHPVIETGKVQDGVLTINGLKFK